MGRSQFGSEDGLEKSGLTVTDHFNPPRNTQCSSRFYSLHGHASEVAQRITHSEEAGRRTLYHGTDSAALWGILSEGLAIPTLVFSERGQERRDAGRLGDGIYFSSDPK